MGEWWWQEERRDPIRCLTPEAASIPRRFHRHGPDVQPSDVSRYEGGVGTWTWRRRERQDRAQPRWRRAYVQCIGGIELLDR